MSPTSLSNAREVIQPLHRAIGDAITILGRVDSTAEVIRQACRQVLEVYATPSVSRLINIHAKSRVLAVNAGSQSNEVIMEWGELLCGQLGINALDKRALLRILSYFSTSIMAHISGPDFSHKAPISSHH